MGKNYLIDDFCHIGLVPEKYSGSEKTIIGENCHIRSHTVIYIGNKIGKNFVSGHGVLIREENIIGDDVSVGSHTIIEHHVNIGNKVRIQGNTFIPEYTTLEDNVWIGPMVILTNARYPGSLHTKKWLKGPTVEEGAKIGAGAIILPGINVGKNSLIGAGSVVVKDVPENSVVVGNPAKILKKITTLNFPDGTPAYPLK